ncbi:MAG: DegT/DnrJ/EryC1/StrS family aminotransferase [Nitrospinota bacterium]
MPLRRFLALKKIETKNWYPGSLSSRRHLKSHGYKKGDCPNAERHAKTSLALPLFPEITDKEIDSVISAVNEFTK